MKTKFLVLACLLSTVCFGQLTDFRSTTASGTAAVKVNSGYTQPSFINIVNDTATVLFVKIYDKATTPYAAVDKPVLTIACPINTSVQIKLQNLFYIKNGMWIRAGKGGTDADSTFNKYKSFPPIIEVTY